MTGRPPNRLFCFGIGFSAQALIRRLDRHAWAIAGTVTSDAAAFELRRHHAIEAFVFDGSRPVAGLRDTLADATHLLVSVPPGAAGDPVLIHHAADIAAAAHLGWIGYLSTIGVYGDRDGEWIDESVEPQPTSDRSRYRRDAEIAWQQLAADSAKRCLLFRLAGIYGPGRSAIDTVRSGRAKRIIKPGQKFNRIHVDDIARVLEASMGGKGTSNVYNLADDEPSPPQDVIAYAAPLLGLPMPPAVPFDDPSLGAMTRSFFGESKLVRNDLVKADLDIQLAYPTYRDGLAAIASEAANHR